MCLTSGVPVHSYHIAADTFTNVRTKRECRHTDVTVTGGNYARVPWLSTTHLREVLDLDGDV